MTLTHMVLPTHSQVPPIGLGGAAGTYPFFALGLPISFLMKSRRELNDLSFMLNPIMGI